MDPTIAHTLQSAIARLEGRTPSPRTDAEELLGRLLEVTRSQLHLERGRALTPRQRERLEGWIERRVEGEPVQYITGRAAFRDLDLAVTPAVLIPRPETEWLVEAVLEVLRTQAPHWTAPRVLDLGTGSGAIGLSIAMEWPAAQVTATDASHAALEVARANAAALGIAGRVRLLAGDWFGAVGDERFEVVVSNPPYVADREADRLPGDVRDHEPRQALFSGPTGLEALEEIAAHAPRHLVPDGLLALELAEMRARDVAARLGEDREWRGIEVRDDLAGRPRILLARRR